MYIFLYCCKKYNEVYKYFWQLDTGTSDCVEEFSKYFYEYSINLSLLYNLIKQQYIELHIWLTVPMELCKLAIIIIKANKSNILITQLYYFYSKCDI